MPQQPTQAQPFSEYLDPSQVAPDNQRIRWDTGQQFSGWGGKAEASAGLFSKFAEGLSQGKLRAFQKNQEESASQLKIISAFTQSQMQRTDLSEAKKNDLLNWQNRAYAQILYPQVKEHTKAEGFGGHAAKAVSSIFGAMGGVNEAGKANPYGPDTFHGLLNAATADVENPANTVQAKIDQANEVWRNGITRINEAARARGPLPATFGEVESSKEYQTALGLYRQAGQAHAAQFAQSVRDTYPDAKDYKARAAAGYENVSAQDAEALKKRALPDIPAGMAPPDKFTGIETPVKPPALVSLGRYGAVRDMNPQEKAEDEQHQQMREYLGGILGIHPDVEWTDPVTGQHMRGTKQQFDASNQSARTGIAAANSQSQIEARAATKSRLNQAAKDLQAYRNKSLSLAQQRVNVAQDRNDIARGMLSLANAKNTTTDLKLMGYSDFLATAGQYALEQGAILDKSFLRDHFEDVIMLSDDTNVQNQKAYIFDRISSGQATQSLADMMYEIQQRQPGGGAAPPKIQAPGGGHAKGMSSADSDLK